MESEPLEMPEPRRSMEETIVAALMDDFTYKIGMLGTVGSSRMASRIGEKVKREKLFKTVVMVRVGRWDDAEDRIAYAISDYLGVGLEGGDVVKHERVLIILDDVLGFVDLERAGIPEGRTCKIVIASRFEKVCLGMGCHVIFKLMEEEEEEEEEEEGEKMKVVPSRPNFSISRSIQHIGHSASVLLEQNFVEMKVVPSRSILPHFNISRCSIQSIDCASVILEQNLSFSKVEMVNQCLIFPKRSRKIETNLTLIALLDLSGSAIQEMQTELKNLRKLRVLDLTNCRSLRTIEPGIISSLVRLEEVYMLGSFSDWEGAGGGKRGGNASIDELERLSNLRALQIQIRDPSIVEESSHIWSRLVSYVVSTPEELECRYQESRSVRFPAVDEHHLQFGGGVLSLHLPRSATPMARWVSLMLKSAECLDLIGYGSKPAVDLLMQDGFKLLKRLHIGHCRKMEYIVDGIVPSDSLFQSLETLSLDDLPLFKEMFNTLSVVELLGTIRYPTVAVKLYRRQVEGYCFSSLRSIHISRCPKLRSLFSSSVARNLRQLEQIRIESCEMMEELFSDEGGGRRRPIELSKLSYLELLDLPRLTRFCSITRVHFPQLKEMLFQGLRKLRIFPLEHSDSDDIQSLFPEKAEFYRPKELDSLTSLSLFSVLELLVVSSCNTLRQLMSCSIAKLLVKLEQLTVEDCLMMERVIADDDSERESAGDDKDLSLFPRLIMVELIGMPSLKSFCDVANDLELPSLEYLALIDCQGMQEFSGGRVSMPVLKYVENDFSKYRIDDAVLSVECLFNDKHLFPHKSPSQAQDQDVELIIDEDRMKEPVLSHSQRISKARTRDIVLHGIEAKSDASISNQNTMIEEEEDIPGSQDNYLSGDGDATEQTNNEAKSEVSVDEVLDIERFLKDFMSFCSLLPRYYEFSKDILVSQWMTGGLIELGEYKMTEEVYAKCFDTLVEMDYFVPSEYDYIFDWMKYRIGDGKKFDSKMINTSVVEHMSVSFKELGVLKQYSCLQTLVVYDSYGVDHLPSDIFSELKTLKILNLSGTNVAALPSSIENLKELRLLDMSKTPIRWLPDTICYFSLLHTLNLDGCLKLERLPKCMNKLTNLQHLVLDMSRLQSIPIGMGNLSKLQALNMFSVGVDDGRRVTELKDLNKLRGSFSLLNLENIRSKEEASEACLHKKTGLRKIELHWSDIQDEKCESEEEILESLQPPSSTQELKILFYSGGVLPSWICNPSFSELVSIVLDECKYCSSLPFLGELTSLKSLSIVENNVLTEIGSSFFRLRANPYREAFPKLEKLSFESMFKLEKWTGFEDGDFPSLRLLIIEYCPVFVGLQFLSRLSSLSGLEIRYCPEFSFLPVDGLPASLESLMIKQSPKLKAQCCDEQWRDWSKVALVPSIYIDDQEFSPKNGVPVTS